MKYKSTILDSIEKRIEDYRIKSGDYPKELELTQAELDLIKIELDKLPQEGWIADYFPQEYRGIKIRIK